MNLYSIMRDCKITRVSNAVAAGTSDISSSVMDMTGFDRIAFVVFLADVIDGSVLTLTARQNTANSSSTPTPTSTGVATAAFTASATSADNKMLMVDVVRPIERYVFAFLTRITQNAAIDGIFAIQYNARTNQVTQPAEMIASVLGNGA